MNCASRRIGSRLIPMCVLLCAVFIPSYAAGESHSGDPKENAIGGCVGIPHTFAVTYEKYLSSHLSTSIHAGTAVLLSSTGARLQWGENRTGLRPYVFAGATLVHSIAEDYGNPEGMTGHLWLGPGVSLRQDRWEIYTDGRSTQR